MYLYTYILALSKTDEYLPVYLISKYSFPQKEARLLGKKTDQRMMEICQKDTIHLEEAPTEQNLEQFVHQNK